MPQAIFRLTGQSQEEYSIFRQQLTEELEKLREQTLGGFLDQISHNCRDKEASTNLKQAMAELEKRWDTLENILSVCNGKDLISLINAWIRRKYHCNSSRARLLEALVPDDICKEMKDVIAMLIEK